MKKNQKLKSIDKNNIQSNAIKSLKLISEVQNGYLQNWNKLNQIRQDDCMLQINQQNTELKQAKNTNSNNLNNKKALSEFDNRRTLRQIKLKNSKRCFSPKIPKPIQTIENYATISPKKLQLVKNLQQQCIIFQKKAQFRRFSQKEELPIKSKSISSFSYDDQAKMHLTRYSRNRKIKSSSMKYLERIRKFSLSGANNLMSHKKKSSFNIEDQKAQQKQDEVRLAEIIKNKLRRKGNNNFVIKKHANEKQKIEKECQNQKLQIVPTKTEMNTIAEPIEQTKQVQLLKTWLDSTRFKTKRSVSSLLRQHFEKRYLEKKKQQQTDAENKSLKLLLVISKHNPNFQ